MATRARDGCDYWAGLLGTCPGATRGQGGPADWLSINRVEPYVYVFLFIFFFVHTYIHLLTLKSVIGSFGNEEHSQLLFVFISSVNKILKCMWSFYLKHKVNLQKLLKNILKIHMKRDFYVLMPATHYLSDYNSVLRFSHLKIEACVKVIKNIWIKIWLLDDLCKEYKMYNTQ